MCYKKMLKLDLRYCEGTKEEVLECEGMERKQWLYGSNHLLCWNMSSCSSDREVGRGYARPGHEDMKLLCTFRKMYLFSRTGVGQKRSRG